VKRKPELEALEDRQLTAGLQLRVVEPITTVDCSDTSATPSVLRGATGAYTQGYTVAVPAAYVSISGIRLNPNETLVRALRKKGRRRHAAV
jgi:hypothetical protein